MLIWNDVRMLAQVQASLSLVRDKKKVEEAKIQENIKFLQELLEMFQKDRSDKETVQTVSESEH